MPEWYRIISVAKYLGVPPWELAAQDAVWFDWAEAARSAEIEAQPKQKQGKGGR